MHTRASLERFGAEAMIPAGLAIALVRETGPLVTALLVSGRVGAGIGAELGAMKVTEQIDALEAVAVDSFKFLAVTRILACILALPLLTTIADICGIFGGYLAETAISGMSWELYFNRAFSLDRVQRFHPCHAQDDGVRDDHRHRRAATWGSRRRRGPRASAARRPAAWSCRPS